eukprot:8809422-Alexandrium_andersonii.AAC.1
MIATGGSGAKGVGEGTRGGAGQAPEFLVWRRSARTPWGHCPVVRRWRPEALPPYAGGNAALGGSIEA